MAAKKSNAARSAEGARPTSKAQLKGYQKRRNWFAVWVSVGVVVALLAVTGLVVWMNNTASAPAVAPAASNVDQETGAVSFGTGPDVVETYVDFLCPYCGQFEEAEGETIGDLVNDGSITLEIHPVAILDRYSAGTEYSSRSAAAFYAVAEADPDNAYAFFEALYANQPAEGTAGLTNEELVSLAEDSGVDMTSDLEAAILEGTYVDFAKEQELPADATGTPTLIINDEIIAVTYDPEVDIIANLTQ